MAKHPTSIFATVGRNFSADEPILAYWSYRPNGPNLPLLALTNIHLYGKQVCLLWNFHGTTCLSRHIFASHDTNSLSPAHICLSRHKSSSTAQTHLSRTTHIFLSRNKLLSMARIRLSRHKSRLSWHTFVVACTGIFKTQLNSGLYETNKSSTVLIRAEHDSTVAWLSEYSNNGGNNQIPYTGIFKCYLNNGTFQDTL